MTWVDQLKDNLPEYAKDIKLNLDAIVNRSSIDPDYALYLSISAAFAAGNGKLVTYLASHAADETEKNAAFAAATIMAQNNVWYPYVEMTGDENFKSVTPQLRMNIIASHGGTTKAKFESYSLIASIIGKCHFCVRAHYDVLKQEGYTTDQLKDIGRLAATINAVAKVLWG